MSEPRLANESTQIQIPVSRESSNGVLYSLHNRDSQQLETEISLTRSRPALNSPLSLYNQYLSSRIFFQVFFSRSHLDLLYCTIPNNPILNDWGERPLIQHHTILNTIVPLTIVNKKTEDRGQRTDTCGCCVAEDWCELIQVNLEYIYHRNISLQTTLCTGE